METESLFIPVLAKEGRITRQPFTKRQRDEQLEKQWRKQAQGTTRKKLVAILWRRRFRGQTVLLRPKLCSLRQFPEFQFLHDRGPCLSFRCIPRKSHIDCAIHPRILKSPQCGFDLHSNAHSLDPTIAYRVFPNEQRDN